MKTLSTELTDTENIEIIKFIKYGIYTSTGNSTLDDYIHKYTNYIQEYNYDKLPLEVITQANDHVFSIALIYYLMCEKFIIEWWGIKPYEFLGEDKRLPLFDIGDEDVMKSAKFDVHRNPSSESVLFEWGVDEQHLQYLKMVKLS